MTKRFQNINILTKVLLFILPLVLLPLLISQIFYLSVMKDLAFKQASLSMENTAREISEKINKHFENANILLKSISLTIPQESNTKKVEGIIKNAMLENSIFRYIFVTNENGMEIANTSINMVYREQKNKEYVLSTLGGKDSSSDILFTKDNFPYLILCTPVEFRGEVKGALCGEVDCRLLWNLLDDIKIGNTGYAYIVSDKGKAIAYPDKKDVLEGKSLSRLEPVKMVLEAKQGVIEYDHNGKKLASFVPIKSRGWGVIVEQSLDESLRLFLKMREYAIYFIILLLIVAILSALFFSIGLTKPIRILANATETISSGNLDYKVPIKSKDEIGRLARSFNEMTARLKRNQEMLIHSEKLASIGQLSAGIAHEIKNPLTGIYGYVQLMERRSGKDETLANYISDLKEELERVNKTVLRLLDFSKQPKFEFKEIDVGQTVEKCLDLVKHHLWNFSRIEVRFENEKELPKVIADSNQLHQVFVNIILNAATAIGKDGLIEVSTTKKDGKVAIAFKDNGTGISEEDIENIFEPFYSRAKDGSGTGLGLYISRNIVKAHNGDISIEGNGEKGTTVVVALPSKRGS